VPIDVELVFRRDDLDDVEATIERAPDSGPLPLTRPRRNEQAVVAREGETRVRVRALAPYEAALITLSSD
jgi:hypothetical protein